jgi:hypothetical protein
MIATKLETHLVGMVASLVKQAENLGDGCNAVNGDGGRTAKGHVMIAVAGHRPDAAAEFAPVAAISRLGEQEISPWRTPGRPGRWPLH